MIGSLKRSLQRNSALRRTFCRHGDFLESLVVLGVVTITWCTFNLECARSPSWYVQPNSISYDVAWYMQTSTKIQACTLPYPDRFHAAVNFIVNNTPGLHRPNDCLTACFLARRGAEDSQGARFAFSTSTLMDTAYALLLNQ